nr:unnamed protein product [uncultured bacterium]
MLGHRIEPNSERQDYKRKVYLNIKNGAIVKRNNGQEETFAYVEGKLSDLSQKDRTFRGEKVVYWYIDLRDDEGELYSIGLPFGSNIFKSIVLALASDMGIEAIRNNSIIRIEPYSRNGYDKVTVWGEGVKLDWIVKTLPPVEEVTIGGRKVKDDTKRMEFICDLANKVKSNIVRK